VTRRRTRHAPLPTALAATLAAVLLASLSGCSLLRSTPPPPEPPELPVELPEDWAGSDALTSPAPPGETWWRDLGGEAVGSDTLAALIDEALAGNYDLAAAAARVEAAAAQARIAGADALPQVGGSLNAARNRQNFIGFPIPGSGGQVLSTTNTSLRAGLNVSWELDLWGRLAAAEGAAVANAQAARADYAAARLSLAGQTAKAWFGVLEAREQVALAEVTLANRERNETWLRRRWESGVAGALDLRLAMAGRASSEALLVGRRRQLDAALRRLELLLGRYPDGDLATGPGTGPESVTASLSTGGTGDTGDTEDGDTEDTGATAAPAGSSTAAPTLLAPPGTEPVPVGLPAELLARRPDLVAAERRVAAAGLSVEEAAAARLPRISLTGSAGRSSEDLEDLLDNDFTVWSLAANLLQPIFQGGRLAAAEDLAEARRREALAGYVSAALAAFSEVEGALATERFLTRQVRALEDASREARQAEELSEERYVAGLTRYLALLESQRQALAARSELISARRGRLDARVDLHLALGGGFEADFDFAEDADPQQIEPAVPEGATAKIDTRTDGDTSTTTTSDTTTPDPDAPAPGDAR